MAQFKDSLISGDLRVTDKVLADTVQAQIIEAPTTSGGITFGTGADGQILKSNGTSTYWGHNIAYFVAGPSTDTVAGTWTGTIEGLTAYFDGLTVYYMPAIAGASTTTLEINELGAKVCYVGGTSQLTTHYAVGSIIRLTYHDDTWRGAMYDSGNTKVQQSAVITTNKVYSILHASNEGTAKTTNVVYKSAMTYNPSTKALVTGGTINGYTLNAACEKGVDSSLTLSSTSTNVPTSAAVAALVSNNKLPSVSSTDNGKVLQVVNGAWAAAAIPAASGVSF